MQLQIGTHLQVQGTPFSKKIKRLLLLDFLLLDRLVMAMIKVHDTVIFWRAPIAQYLTSAL